MKNRYGLPSAIGLTCLIAGAFAPSHAQAQGRLPSEDPTADWIPLTPERLDTMRGGFSLPSGLNLSFGIERAVFIDGVLMTSTSLNIPNVGRMTTDEATALAAATAPLLLQNGPGNVVTAGSGHAGLTIQNTLDDQVISSLTTLNISVDTLGLYKTLNAHSTVQDALTILSAGH